MNIRSTSYQIFLATFLFHYGHPQAVNESTTSSALSSTKKSDFCSAKRYQSILFIAQQQPRKYLIFSQDDFYYAGTYDGIAFTDIPAGPFKLTESLAGVKSLAAFFASSPEVPFANLLFISPLSQTEPSPMLQFLGEQVWFIKDGVSTKIHWPSTGCPSEIRSIINRAIQPHLLFDQDSYAYNFSVNVSTGQPACGPRSEVRLFLENSYYAMLGVDPPHRTVQDGTPCAGIKLYRWMRSRVICRSCLLPNLLNQTTPFCDMAASLPNQWQFFACPDPNVVPTSGWLIALYVVVGVLIFVALAIGTYFLAKWLFLKSKDEIAHSGAFSSQIG